MFYVKNILARGIFVVHSYWGSGPMKCERSKKWQMNRWISHLTGDYMLYWSGHKSGLWEWERAFALVSPLPANTLSLCIDLLLVTRAVGEKLDAGYVKPVLPDRLVLSSVKCPGSHHAYRTWHCNKWCLWTFMHTHTHTHTHTDTHTHTHTHTRTHTHTHTHTHPG